MISLNYCLNQNPQNGLCSSEIEFPLALTLSLEVKSGRLLLYMEETSSILLGWERESPQCFNSAQGWMPLRRHRDILVHFESCVTEAHEGRVGEKSVESWHCLREKPNHISGIPVRIQRTRTMACLG